MHEINFLNSFSTYEHIINVAEMLYVTSLSMEKFWLFPKNSICHLVACSICFVISQKQSIYGDIYLYHYNPNRLQHKIINQNHIITFKACIIKSIIIILQMSVKQPWSSILGGENLLNDSVLITSLNRKRGMPCKSLGEGCITEHNKKALTSGSFPQSATNFLYTHMLCEMDNGSYLKRHPAVLT